MKTQIVIPARLASTRLAEKLLRRVGGKSILQYTYEAALRSQVADGVTIAVDDRQLAEEAERFGGAWMMTSPNCASGTDRIAEVAAAMPGVDVFVNVQGDEPEIEPSTIDLVARTLIDDSEAKIATAGTPIRTPEMLGDPNCVKIVVAADDDSPRDSNSAQGGADHDDTSQSREGRPGKVGRAIYFSRSPVPHPRGGVSDEQLAAEPPLFWHHIGLYAYRGDFLRWFAAEPPSPLELTEKLEQLRAIEAGQKIVVARIPSATPGIDTKADLAEFTRRIESES